MATEAQKRAIKKYQKSAKGKLAIKKYLKKWRLKNKEKISAYKKSEKGKLSNKKAITKYFKSSKGKETLRKWRKKNKDKLKKNNKEYHKEYYSSDKWKNYKKKYNKEYRKTDTFKDSQKKAQKKYLSSKKGREAISRGAKNYYEKNKNNPDFKLIKNLRKRLVNFLKSKGMKKNSRILVLTGCSKYFLKSYIEKKFKPGMSWENYGKWHIDHIFPLSKFDFENPDSLKRACHYSNLQPLWALENIKKKNTI